MYDLECLEKKLKTQNMCVANCWTLDVSRIASYEITLIRVSVCPSVCPSLIFLKIGSLVFSDIIMMIADHNI